MSSLFKRCAVAVAFLVCVAAGWFSWSVQAQQSMTLSQGVYSADQAKRGQSVYSEQCATCHGDALGGRLGPPLSGEDFVGSWNKEPLSELYNKIRNTMPQGSPGKLSVQQTADIVAYILQVGKFPVGRAELRGDEAALKQIVWSAGTPAQPKPASASASASAVSFPPAGNMAQVMRGILFPSSNIIFTVQTHDPNEKRSDADKAATEKATSEGGFNWAIWGNNLYSGWELVDYAAVALAESAPLMLTPGRRCENGKPVPVNDPEWVKYTNELAEAGKAAYKASQSRNQEAVSDISNVVADACLNCHQVYRDKRRAGVDPIDPSNKANRCVK